VSPIELPQGTVTFLFTDIEGSTDLARKLGADFGRIRAEHHRIMREAIESHAGHEIDTAGDGFFVAFERARDAVAAALEAQRALLASESDDAVLRVRMGLHSAEPYLHEGSYVGVGVHRAARICAAGHGGQILLSNATAGVVEDLALEGIELEDLGEHRLKDLDHPQRLFQLVAEGLPSSFPSLRTSDSSDSLPAVVTLLQVDVVGWSAVLRTLGDDEAGAAAARYQRIVVDAVRAEGGREREIAGDNVIAIFDLPIDALRAALRARAALCTEPWFPDVEAPPARMAIHSGRMTAGGHAGSAHFRCLALCSSAEPGQILVSHATEALLEGEVRDIATRDLGERTLPGFDDPVRVFEVAT
jgi:class 3 adenylate cyclase